MAIPSPIISHLDSYQFKSPLLQSPNSLLSRLSVPRFLKSANLSRKTLQLDCRSIGQQDDGDYLLDAPVTVGDGFSFSGGKYSDGPSPADEWFKQGKLVKAHTVRGSGEKAKDPIFGLKMGSSSQASDDVFRWFCVESGNDDNPVVLLIHGFPSQVHGANRHIPTAKSFQFSQRTITSLPLIG